ncbi:MAG: 30S ribosomal protein S17 [Deltaproteobacteria bacterium]|nr:30S ribosomal protein S17 [Deltaproteobacteria bacterium]
MDQKTTNKKTKVGTVISNKMQKTVTVSVDRLVMHPEYKKYYKRNSTFKAHDEKGQCKVGDQVEIIETRPLSKTKRWAVRAILKKAAGGE